MKDIRKAARRREQADAARLKATEELREHCLAAQAAGAPVSQIAKAARLSRQGVYNLLGQEQPAEVS